MTYDEKTTALRHQRKDKHIFTYLYFIYMLIAIIWKICICIRDDNTSMGLVNWLVLNSIILTINGDYSVLTICIFLDLIRQPFPSPKRDNSPCFRITDNRIAGQNYGLRRALFAWHTSRQRRTDKHIIRDKHLAHRHV